MINVFLFIYLLSRKSKGITIFFIKIIKFNNKKIIYHIFSKLCIIFKTSENEYWFLNNGTSNTTVFVLFYVVHNAKIFILRETSEIANDYKTFHRTFLPVKVFINILIVIKS